MKPSPKIFLSSFIIILVLGLSFFFVQKINAQSAPQMVVTWHAYGSYVPSTYIGKAIPNQESKISASLALVVNQKLVDLSGQTVYWYLNNTLVGGGAGKTYIVFSPFGTAPAYLTLRAEIPNYNGGFLIHEIQIPLFTPRVVIEAPHPSGQFTESKISLKGAPYFFYTSDSNSLSYIWSVNGVIAATAENPETLQIDINPSTPSGSLFATSLTVRNANDNTTNNDSTNIVYIKQL